MHVLIVSGLAGYSQSDLCDLGRSSLASEGEGRVADALLLEIKSFPPSLAQANDPPLMDPGGSQRWSSCLGCECVRLKTCASADLFSSSHRGPGSLLCTRTVLCNYRGQ